MKQRQQSKSVRRSFPVCYSCCPCIVSQRMIVKDCQEELGNNIKDITFSTNFYVRCT
jgi:hypothetical protein